MSELDIRSVVDAVANALRGLVLDGSLPPGTRLTEHGVAARFDVARPTAKAGIERLVYDGLLRRSANKTARVPKLTIDEIEDLYYSRIFLESKVVSNLAGGRVVPDNAHDALARMRRAVAGSSLTDIVATDIAFHRALVTALRSAHLSHMHNSILGEAHLCMAQVQVHHLLNADEILAEHVGILSAIQAGSTEAAGKALTDHLIRAKEHLVSYLRQVDDASGAADSAAPVPRGGTASPSR